MFESDLRRRLGIILAVVGALLAGPLPFAIVVMRHEHLETLTDPTPEELRASPLPILSAVIGIVVCAAGAWMIFRSSRK